MDAAKRKKRAGATPSCAAFSRPTFRWDRSRPCHACAVIRFAACIRSEQTVCKTTRKTNRKEEKKKPMAILKSQPKKPNTATIQARVEDSVKFQLDKYAEFIHSSPSYVITEALKLLFKRDEEFKQWLNQHPNNRNGQVIEGGLFTKSA